MEPLQLVRPEVRRFEPYLPGKPIAEVRRELGLRKIVKLASNENALGASPRALRALRSGASDVFRYPDGSGRPLRRAIARRLKVSESEVILGAGSDEVIEVLAKTFFSRADEVVVSEHAFIRYKMAADLMGAKAVVVPMRGGRHDLDAMAARVTRRTKAVFVANPNNPTGTYVRRDETARFLARLRRSPAFVVFDEAYYEFARAFARDYPETLDFFRRRSANLVVLRTFSKIYGLAGLRVGYGIAPAAAVRAMDTVRPPFNVSTPAQRAALAALADAAHVRRSLRAVRAGMRLLADGLAALGLESFPSVGNFLLVDVSPRRGSDLFRALLRRGVIVRSMDEYGFPNHVRVTAGRRDEILFFLAKLKEVIAR